MEAVTQPTETRPIEQRNKWILLKCRFCEWMMHGVSHRATQNEQTGQTYVETRYNCPHCDFWERLTIPRKIALTIVDEQYLPSL